MPNDLEGHPTATYVIDVSSGVFPLVLEGIKEQFDSVKVVEQTNGQSIQSLHESFPVLVEQALERLQKNRLARNLDRVAQQIWQTGRFQHYLPAEALAKLHQARALIASVRETTEQWKLD